MGVLADADVGAVEAHDEDALGGADVEHDALAGPGRGDLEVALVDAGRVALGDGRRPARERHLDVRVVRHVPGAGHRPEARNGRLDPVRPIGWRRASASSWNRQRPSSGSRSRWGTLCIGSRLAPVSSGDVQAGSRRDCGTLGRPLRGDAQTVDR